jgi:hypothetical protein
MCSNLVLKLRARDRIRKMNVTKGKKEQETEDGEAEKEGEEGEEAFRRQEEGLTSMKHET